MAVPEATPYSSRQAEKSPGCRTRISALGGRATPDSPSSAIAPVAGRLRSRGVCHPKIRGWGARATLTPGPDSGFVVGRPPGETAGQTRSAVRGGRVALGSGPDSESVVEGRPGGDADPTTRQRTPDSRARLLDRALGTRSTVGFPSTLRGDVGPQAREWCSPDSVARSRPLVLDAQRQVAAPAT
jgi:hypothetical protein